MLYIFWERFRSFVNKSELVEPMIRFMFISVFIGWPSGRMVRHLISSQKIPGSNPGRVICEAGYEASTTSNSPRVAGGPRIETSFCYLFSFFLPIWVARQNMGC